MANDKTIKLENGKTVLTYPSSLRGTMINSNNCDTEYEETRKGSGIYREVKK